MFPSARPSLPALSTESCQTERPMVRQSARRDERWVRVKRKRDVTAITADYAGSPSRPALSRAPACTMNFTTPGLLHLTAGNIA